MEIMVRDGQEVAYFYRIKDGKPALIARWGCGEISQYNELDIQRDIRGAKTYAPANMRDNLIKYYEGILDTDVAALKPVSNKMKEVIHKILTETIILALGGTLENPILEGEIDELDLAKEVEESFNNFQEQVDQLKYDYYHELVGLIKTEEDARKAWYTNTEACKVFWYNVDRMIVQLKGEGRIPEE